jgi:murein DD-endopeptidase
MPAPAGRTAVILVAFALVTAGCTPFRAGLPGDIASTPAGVPGTRDAGAELAQAALRYVGVPYRYGGAEPSRGFDCSGLVAYVHGQGGISVPRTAAAQFASARRVSEAELQPGDLVFFRLSARSRDVTHVGIYTGGRRFVHAPQTGSRVGEASLDDAYYRARYAGSGRFYAAPSAQARGGAGAR